MVTGFYAHARKLQLCRSFIWVLLSTSIIAKGYGKSPLSMVADLLQQISSIFPVNTLLYLGASTYFFYLSSLTIFNCRLHYALQLSSINYSHLRSSRAKKLTLLSPHCEDALKTFYLRVVLLEWSKRTSPRCGPAASSN